MPRMPLLARPRCAADMPDDIESQRNRDMASIANAIGEPHGLQVEILLWAFYHQKQRPEATVAECIQVGFDEWVK
jgi:hypothetical protein